MPLKFVRLRSGFTLLEAMMVVIIMGMLAAVSYKQINVTIADQRVSRAAIEVSNQMQAAFALSMRDRKPMQITFDTAKVQFKIADRAGNVFRVTGLAGFNITSSNVTLSRATLEVYPVGLAQDSLSVTLTSSANGKTFTRRVRMTRGGLVQVL
jgi:prepilin-type N-terminal cleavage/methylation domain-containing protein